MGASLQDTSRLSRSGSRFRRSPMAEINVTPFVDVMLVLLIIFMVTAPLLTVGVPVDLPKTKAAVEIPPAPDLPLPLQISVGQFSMCWPKRRHVTVCRHWYQDPSPTSKKKLLGNKSDAQHFFRRTMFLDAQLFIASNNLFEIR